MAIMYHSMLVKSQILMDKSQFLMVLHIKCPCVLVNSMNHPWIGCVWKCRVSLNPMVLLIVIPIKNGYFIGNIPNIFRQTQFSSFYLTVSPVKLSHIHLLAQGHSFKARYFLTAHKDVALVLKCRKEKEERCGLSHQMWFNSKFDA